ncbi:DUF4345 domain-containing protein [Moraxellaceae bacterium AER2_44_116]|nr:DUF4345 domain-containing protein [Moraxellaceae bacterium]TQC99721.1 DUF4345 domain-containing protein [Moraxellaceae bacterium AER2_44_116]
MTRLTQLFLLLSGLGFILIGVNTFRDPIAAMAGVELGVQSINALNEVRANYGGMQMGIGLLLISAALMTWLTRPALLALSLVTGGLVIGRLMSVMIDGMPNSTVQALLGLEFFTTVIAIFLFTQQPNSKTI